MMKIRANAKINWLLDITGVRDDGYHLMDMLMQPVTLHDTIMLEPDCQLTLTVEGTPYIPPDSRHLAMRAAAALREAAGCGKGAHIHVIKRIPAGAGMGGGSADAAAVLHGLNRLWGLSLDRDALCGIGLKLGADVPFCLMGGLRRVQGIGEIMTEAGPAPTAHLCVIQPCEGLPTGEVFRLWHRAEAVRNHPDIDETGRMLAGMDIRGACGRLFNALQPVSESLRPEIGEACRLLELQGAVRALMTGSGSAVFGVFDSAEQAEAACRSLQTRYASCRTCETCSEGVVIEEDN